MSERPNLVIYYHSPCADGHAAAWAIKSNLLKVPRFRPIDQYGNSKYNIIYKPSKPGCPNLDAQLISPSGSEFWFVDLMPTVEKFQELINIIEQPNKINPHKNRIVILDHHKSNMEICTKITAQSLKCNKTALYEMKRNGRTITSKGPNNIVSFIFDIGRSGCQIAWDWITCEMNGTSLTRPWFINYIGDSDLWSWKLPNSQLINTAFTGLGLTNSPDDINQLNNYKSPDEINKYIESELLPFAKISEKINDGLIKNAILKSCACSFVIPSGKEFNVWLANISPELRSELGNKLCKIPLPDGSLPDLAAIWNYDYKANEWQISLRSIGKLVDCSLIAQEFTEGGGHLNAAGFSIKNIDGGNLYYYFVPL